MAREKLKISKSELQRCVDELESTKTFVNASELWKAVESTDWAKSLKPRPLTAPVAYARATELGVVCKSIGGGRGRKKIKIDKAVFQRVVDQLEASQTFPNPSHLWKAVENTDWAKGQTPRPLTAAVAYMRAKELGIVCKTLPGKRGGTMTEERIAKMRSSGRRPRSVKMAAFTPTFKEMKATYPVTLLPMIERAEKGSLKAALGLKCLECSGFQRAEIRNCACPGCALYPHRPGATELANLSIPEEETETVETVVETPVVEPVATIETPAVETVVMAETPVVEPVVVPIIEEVELMVVVPSRFTDHGAYCMVLTEEEMAIMAELKAEVAAATAA